MSDLFKLDLNDFLRGVITAVAGSVLNLLYQMLQNRDVIDLKELAAVAATAMVGYLVKNLFTDENGKLVGKTQIHYK